MGRGLGGPGEGNTARNNATSDCQGAFDIHQEVGIEERDLLNSVTTDKLNQFIDYAIRPVGIEAAFVENHVRTVVTGIGTTHATGVAELARSGSRCLNVKVAQVISWRRQIVDVSHRTFRLVMGAGAILE